MNTSMNIAASGLKAAETQLEVRAHNIANMNTEDFKGSRAIQAEQSQGTRIAAIEKSG